MHGTWRRGAAVMALVGTGAMAAPAAAPPRAGAGPVARYTVDAGTSSGMGAMGAGGGLGAAMRMMRGGGGQATHELTLRLGSTRPSAGAPRGDHFMPAGALLGPSVPLLSPERGRSDEAMTGGMPQGQMPRGRLLLYWGCGEHAGPGQPVVIDFAKMARGQVPPGLFAQGVSVPGDWQVSSASTSFGEWPNGRDRKALRPGSSLLGAHRVTSNYAPDIAFTLTDDFMPALDARQAGLPSGATRIDWNALPRATGYYAWAMGAKSGGGGEADMVWWTSASSRQFGGALADWLSPAAVAKLVAAKTVMPASQTSCTIPAEVKAAGGAVMMTQLYGYGPQADFAYPPRPAGAKVPWKPEWIARVRFRSTTSLMLGMPGMGAMGGMGAVEGAPGAQPGTPAKPRCRGLKGIAMRAAGLCE